MKKSQPIEHYRSSLGFKAEVQSDLAGDYHSAITDWLREHDFQYSSGDTTVALAREFGFCYGVDKAVDMAYEALRKFPERRIFLTTEIIHNPRVNGRLRELGIRFLSGNYGSECSYNDLAAGDVVLIPAFGVSTEVEQGFRDRGVILVDTTCGSVIHVWKRVERYATDGFTSVIHGKYYHEETIATASKAGHYLIVRNKEEAARVCDYIVNGGDRDQFLNYFKNACSEGFEPDFHLHKVGVANQTTMLSSESLEIAVMLRQAFLRKVGPERLDQVFRSFDTICTATQDRQDAIRELAKTRPDLFIIVGGFNSSNTSHLAEIAARDDPAYHIDDASCMISADDIRHLRHPQGDIVVSKNWLPSGPVRVAFTAGASTPNRVVGEAIARLLELRGITEFP
ncbi:MAG: 4-hydroxy-3-methylbut-2-enyl diphosphate reductase [bacterium]